MPTQNLKVQIGVRGRQPERGTDRNETKPENELGLWKRQVLKTEPPAPGQGESESPGWERIGEGGWGDRGWCDW